MKEGRRRDKDSERKNRRKILKRGGGESKSVQRSSKADLSGEIDGCDAEEEEGRHDMWNKSQVIAHSAGGTDRN